MIGLAILACAAVALPARAGTVGPRQHFIGVINGHDGNTTKPITIKVACSGPSRTGHPLGGQTLAVHQVFPPAAVAGSVGRTGRDSRIGVFFNAPPPDAAGTRPAAQTPVFTRYDKPRPLPTSLTLPCQGTATVWFTPIPVVPPSQSATAPVRYVGES